ncbi:MAG: hypothetical protein RL764_858 [Pseudomonadota bacterium]
MPDNVVPKTRAKAEALLAQQPARLCEVMPPELVFGGQRKGQKPALPRWETGWKVSARAVGQGQEGPFCRWILTKHY